jgi:hypothetical protein
MPRSTLGRYESQTNHHRKVPWVWKVGLRAVPPAAIVGQPLASLSQPSGIPAFESAAAVTEQLSSSRVGAEGLSADGMSGLRDPAPKVDSRILAIGTLVTLLHQLSEADLPMLIDHARQMAGKE